MGIKSLTDLAIGARFFGAGVETFPITTSLSGTTFDFVAAVECTATFQTDHTRSTRCRRIITVDACPALTTRLASRTLDALARIDTVMLEVRSVYTHLTGATWVIPTGQLFTFLCRVVADESRRTLTTFTIDITLKCPGLFDTLTTWTGLHSVVNLTITVVVFSVTDLWLRLGCVTKTPVTVDTALFTGTTCGCTVADQTFVDLTVTIVIITITDFGLGSGRVTCGPLAVVADLDALSTLTATLTFEVFVGHTVTVIIDTVTDFGVGGDTL